MFGATVAENAVQSSYPVALPPLPWLKLLTATFVIQ
jgi:hypothetical protein